MQDLEKMNGNAIRKYEQQFNNISEELKKDFSEFSKKEEKNFIVSPNVIPNDYEMAINMDNYVNEFISQYPKYKNSDKSQFKKEIELLRFNPVVSAVRKYFSSNGYELSLTLFNHSLTDNPADAKMDLIGNSEGMYSHIKGLLYTDGFVEKMDDFSKAGSSYKTKSDSSYVFNEGDLYWAIHGFTWKRTRTMYDKAYFKIIDVYDFNKWKDIPGIVAGVSGTNDFDIEIYGLVKNGTLQ